MINLMQTIGSCYTPVSVLKTSIRVTKIKLHINTIDYFLIFTKQLADNQPT